jgi:hypothetical protein
MLRHIEPDEADNHDVYRDDSSQELGAKILLWILAHNGAAASEGHHQSGDDCGLARRRLPRAPMRMISMTTCQGYLREAPADPCRI